MRANFERRLQRAESLLRKRIDTLAFAAQENTFRQLSDGQLAALVELLQARETDPAYTPTPEQAEVLAAYDNIMLSPAMATVREAYLLGETALKFCEVLRERS